MANAMSNLPEEYAQKLYQRLSALLLGMNASSRELADMLNISEDVIESWIKGKRYPKVQYLGAVAKVLGVSVDYLLCRTDNSERITSDEIRKRYYNGKLIADRKNEELKRQ